MISQRSWRCARSECAANDDPEQCAMLLILLYTFQTITAQAAKTVGLEFPHLIITSAFLPNHKPPHLCSSANSCIYFTNFSTAATGTAL